MRIEDMSIADLIGMIPENSIFGKEKKNVPKRAKLQDMAIGTIFHDIRGIECIALNRNLVAIRETGKREIRDRTSTGEIIGNIFGEQDGIPIPEKETKTKSVGIPKKIDIDKMEFADIMRILSKEKPQKLRRISATKLQNVKTGEIIAIRQEKPEKEFVKVNGKEFAAELVFTRK